MAKGDRDTLLIQKSHSKKITENRHAKTYSAQSNIKNYSLTFLNYLILWVKMDVPPSALKKSMFRDHIDVEINTSISIE